MRRALRRNQFTSKKRDSETGLDDFLARHYSSTQGRFISPDPFNPLIGGNRGAIADYANQPQNWNKYSYVLNQPLRYIDPDGKVPVPLILAGIGAGVGGVLGVVGKYIELSAKGEKVTGGKLAAAALSGAISGAVAGLTGGVSLSGQIVIGSVTSIATGALEREIDGDHETDAFNNPNDILQEHMAGSSARLLGG